MMNFRFCSLPTIRLECDHTTAWADMVALYKGPRFNYRSKLRIVLANEPAVDTGGVRRQIYTSVFMDFANNKFVHLFEGPPNSLRPASTAEARSSGLFKTLGGMIGHSLCQDGIGFPHLSPTCYWFLVGGEEKAVEYASVEDLPADVDFLQRYD